MEMPDYTNPGAAPPPTYNPPGPVKYEIKKLNDTHLAIIRLLVLGLSDKEIADTLGVTPAMVQYTKNSAIVKDQIAVMRAKLDAAAIDTAIMIQELAPVSILKLGQILVTETDNRIVQQVARDILDRAGHGATKNINISGGAMDAAHIAKIKAEAVARARANGHLAEPKVQDAVIVSEEEDGSSHE